MNFNQYTQTGRLTPEQRVSMGFGLQSPMQQPAFSSGNIEGFDLNSNTSLMEGMDLGTSSQGPVTPPSTFNTSQVAGAAGATQAGMQMLEDSGAVKGGGAGTGALKGAAGGAAAGAAFGPWGAAIGGVLGGTAGVLKARSSRKKEEAQAAQFRAQQLSTIKTGELNAKQSAYKSALSGLANALG